MWREHARGGVTDRLSEAARTHNATRYERRSIKDAACGSIESSMCHVKLGGGICTYLHIRIVRPLRRRRNPAPSQVVVDGVTRFEKDVTASKRAAQVRLLLFFSMNAMFHWYSALQQGSSV